MPLRFLFDENIRGMLWDAAKRFNLTSPDPIDVVQVGDPPGLPLGTRDPELLLWAEREERILVTSDLRSIPRHLRDHLSRGHHSRGIFVIVRRIEVRPLLEFLSLVAHASEPTEWRDRIEVIKR